MASPHMHGCWVKFAIDLHPSRSEDVMGGVKEQLNELLLRYNEDLEGVVLSYAKERIISTQARIHPYFPYFHVDVTALVFLFKPAVGKPIAGVVNAIGQDYIGVLVLGIFNAAIGRAQIPAHIQHRPLEDCWSSSKDRHNTLKVGSELRFTVHKVDHEGDFFTLVGSLLKPATPAVCAAVPAAGALGSSAWQQAQEFFARAAVAAAAGGAATPPVAAAASSPAVAAPAAAATADPVAKASAAADGGAAKQQPDHRKKSKRRDSVALSGVANGLDSTVKPPKKKKRKTDKAAA